jgi:spore cortex biosynthesis protein YabQ
MLPLDLQIYVFSVFTLAGIALGVSFDFYRAFRHITRPRGWLAGLEDLLFCGLAASLLLFALLLGNWGEVRLYVLLAMSLGLILYYFLASHALLALFTAGLKSLRVFLCRLWSGILLLLRLLTMVLIPFRFLRRLILLPIVALSRAGRHLGVGIKRWIYFIRKRS